MKTIIVDLDHGLCDSRHREHLLQARDFEEYHLKAVDDGVLQDVSSAVQLLSQHYLVLGLTTRPIRHTMRTKSWLRRVCPGVDHVLMRPDTDYSPEPDIKKRLVIEAFDNSLPSALASVEFVLCSHDKLVETWREAGFLCWQPRAGGMT